MVVVGSGVLSSMGTTGTTQLTDKVDSPHSGLFKALHAMSQGNLALDFGGTDSAGNFGFSHTYTAPTGGSGWSVVVQGGVILNEGKLVTIADSSSLTLNQLGSGTLYHWIVVENGASVLSRVSGTTDSVVPDIPAQATPISLIKVQSTDTSGDLATQFFTTTKQSNSVSIGYDNSGEYAEVSSITGTSDGLFISNIGTATVASSDKVLIQDAGSSDVIKTVTASSLAALSGAALTGSTNNTITTVTGANAIQGEANLTFDGKSMVVNTDTSGDGAEDLVGLHVDFDRTVAGSGTAAHNDIGINLDVNSASLGTSSVIGMDIDVVGATSGTSTATGLTVDVGSADTNYAALFSGGNVGIGTSTPTALLEVKGDTTLSRSADNSETRTLILEGARFATGTAFAQIDLKNYDSNGPTSYVGARIASFNEATGVDDGNLVISTSNAGSLAERMRIKDSGEVVIGTDLQLSTSSDDVIIQNVTSNKDIILQVNDGGSSGTEVMRIDGSESRVGIGATAPSAKLEVSGDTTISRSSDSGETRTVIIEGARNATGTDFARIDLKNYDSHGPTSYVGARISAINEVTGVDDGSLVLSTANAGTLAERMRITDAGNVGIGTSSPDTNAALSIEGALSLDEISAPTNTADRGQLYTNSDNELHMIDGAGTDEIFLKGGKHTIWVPAAAMYPNTTGGCAALAQVELTNGPELKVLDFDASSDEFAQFTVSFPKSWNEGVITFQPFWTVTGTNTGTVAWQLSGVAFGDSDDINTAFGTQVATTAKAHSGTTNDMMVSAESGNVTISGASVDSVTYFQINRDISADNQTGDARLIGIKIFYTVDAGNDA